MDAQVKWYADPYEGIVAQLTELKGFVKIVHPLITAQRNTLWDNIGSRRSDGSQEQIDVYSTESGTETGWGFAPYDRTIYSSALVLAWETFSAFLVRDLQDLIALCHGPQTLSPILDIVSDEVRQWSRGFDRLARRYKEWLGFELQKWPEIREVRLSRNAIVHNQGEYTREYIKLTPPRY